MSEQVLRILLSEIQTVRVICQKCKTVVEVPIENMKVTFANGECHFCHASFNTMNIPNYDALGDLARAITEANRLSSVSVEMVLPIEKD
jgi:hypothetical protein